MTNADFITYWLDDESSPFHGRKVILVREDGTVDRVVRVAGTRQLLATSLWRMARSPVIPAQS